MRTGGRRRLLIPPSLAFAESGVGPIPQSPFDRRKLNKIGDAMAAAGGGTYIYDVELLDVIQDEADLGYYEDESIGPADFLKLKSNLQKNAVDALDKLPKEDEGTLGMNKPVGDKNKGMTPGIIGRAMEKKAPPMKSENTVLQPNRR